MFDFLQGRLMRAASKLHNLSCEDLEDPVIRKQIEECFKQFDYVRGHLNRVNLVDTRLTKEYVSQDNHPVELKTNGVRVSRRGRIGTI